MGEYKSLYEKYYRDMNKNNSSNEEKFKTLEEYLVDDRKKNKSRSFLKKLMWQTIGALIFLTISFFMKNSEIKEVQEVFNTSKTMINKTYKVDFLQELEKDLKAYLYDLKVKLIGS